MSNPKEQKKKKKKKKIPRKALIEMEEGKELNNEWSDITSLISKVTSTEMFQGEMMAHAYFSLKGSLSALELMDPKMDVGMIKDVLTIEKAKADGLIPDDLTNEQVLIIMDQLLACEATFHLGQSIGHSIFTCLYAHDTTIIKNEYLKAYLQCMLLTNNYIYDVILNGHVFQDEDFVPNKFHFSLCEDIDINIIYQQIDNIINKANKNDDKYLHMIYDRLKFRKILLQIHISLLKDNGNNLNQYIIQAISLLNKIKDNTLLNDQDEHQKNNNINHIIGFNESITTHLLPNLPPRKCNIISIHQTLVHYTQLLQELLLLTKLKSLSNLEDIFLFMHEFARNNCLLITRSYCIYLFGTIENFLNINHINILTKNSIYNFCSSSNFSTYIQIDKVIQQQIDIFISRAAQPTIQLLRILCDNSARQWSIIPTILNDWKVLQYEAIQLDYQISLLLTKNGFDLNSYGAPYKKLPYLPGFFIKLFIF